LSDGFERLEELPRDLSGQGQLLGLFRPDKPTRREFKLLRGSLGLNTKGWLAQSWWKTRALWAAFRHKSRLQRIVDNGFGLCSGMAIDNPPKADEIAPLTVWLTEKIDHIAGKDDGKPLTFGDLRNAPKPPALEELECGEHQRSIDLRAVTTCVTFGRPLELPLDGNKLFAFDEAEWRALFPAYIVEYLLKFKCSVDHQSKYERSLEALLENKDAPPTAKFGSNAQYEAAKHSIEELLAYAAQLEALGGVCRESDHNGEPCTRPFCGGPRPPIEIAGRARM